ncbi:phospholipase effector Tle1 domain-containing protein [Litoreibacter janthinus]|uniref:Uncharacterized alpha/beta hydrolase domain n=1 Tax=Litoreibacter janthinus TaxID=670154 RepID=A0A1I6FVX4_9RHOB|nr:DUF2235 domain-containing protein [Litoreibacter janthinus]SFR34036.1 Uncharacterized alpha/beta hydrolase domain [Litoreibacter janthinus]
MVNLTDVDAEATAASADLEGETGNIAQTCPDVTLEIGVFFDGTGNNRYNVLSRAREDDSYKAAQSNPALLYTMYKDGPYYNEANACGGVGRAFRSIYVDGPGTTRGEEDDTQGTVFGMGTQSGVEARVLLGFRQVLRQIRALGGPLVIGKVVLDVFGFSRGAAAARYFVNCIRARTIRYDPWGPGDFTENLPEGLEVEIRFVGVFDTVAAIGDADDDDNGNVNVHVKTAQVTGQIFHLTAKDEYRNNFRLNRNNPSGGGDTLGCPGAHSDVGGGYSGSGDTAPLGRTNRRTFDTRAQAEAAQAATRSADLASGVNAADELVFVNEGWLNASEPTGGIVRDMTPVTPYSFIVSARGVSRQVTRYAYDEQRALYRPWVKLGLSRVALHMMYDAAAMHLDGAMLGMFSGVEYQIPAGLAPYESDIRAGALSGTRRRSVLREYGHVSMKDGPYYSSEWLGHRPDDNHVRTEYDNIPGRAV